MSETAVAGVQARHAPSRIAPQKVALARPICRYVVPPQQAEVFEAAVAGRCGDHALARLTGKGIFEMFSAGDLAALGVKRFVQMPGTGVMTFPVSPRGPQA